MSANVTGAGTLPANPRAARNTYSPPCMSAGASQARGPSCGCQQPSAASSIASAGVNSKIPDRFPMPSQVSAPVTNRPTTSVGTGGNRPATKLPIQTDTGPSSTRDASLDVLLTSERFSLISLTRRSDEFLMVSAISVQYELSAE